MQLASVLLLCLTNMLVEFFMPFHRKKKTKTEFRTHSKCLNPKYSPPFLGTQNFTSHFTIFFHTKVYLQNLKAIEEELV